jgi:hypothetical protein
LPAGITLSEKGTEQDITLLLEVLVGLTAEGEDDSNGPRLKVVVRSVLSHEDGMGDSQP